MFEDVLPVDLCCRGPEVKQAAFEVEKLSDRVQRFSGAARAEVSSGLQRLREVGPPSSLVMSFCEGSSVDLKLLRVALHGCTYLPIYLSTIYLPIYLSIYRTAELRS